MSDDQRFLRRRLAAEAGFTGTAQDARKYFADSDESVRAAAFGALCRLDAVDLDSLLAALADPSAAVRRRGLLAIPPRWGGGFDAEIDLEMRLADQDPDLLEVACFVAGECEPSTERIIERLESIAATHDEPLCRESAVAALGALGWERSLPVVLAACSDRATIRRRAVLALVAFDDDAADEMLRTLCNDADWQVRQSAEELVAIGGPHPASAGPDDLTTPTS